MQAINDMETAQHMPGSDSVYPPLEDTELPDEIRAIKEAIECMDVDDRQAADNMQISE